MGCREDVALGGKKRSEQILILLSLGELGPYLRLIQTWGAPSQISHQFSNPFFPNVRIYPTFLCPRHGIGSFVIAFKQHGFSYLSMTKTRSFRPSMIAVSSPVRRTLLCLPPAHFSFFKLRVFEAR